VIRRYIYYGLNRHNNATFSPKRLANSQLRKGKITFERHVVSRILQSFYVTVYYDFINLVPLACKVFPNSYIGNTSWNKGVTVLILRHLSGIVLCNCYILSNSIFMLHFLCICLLCTYGACFMLAQPLKLSKSMMRMYLSKHKNAIR